MLTSTLTSTGTSPSVIVPTAKFVVVGAVVFDVSVLPQAVNVVDTMNTSITRNAVFFFVTPFSFFLRMAVNDDKESPEPQYRNKKVYASGGGISNNFLRKLSIMRDNKSKIQCVL